MNDDISPPDKQTREQLRLDRLKERLAQKHWDFSKSYNSFDGFSEGVCLLGGIDPTSSQEVAGQYGASFLPGGLKKYWEDQPYPSWDRAEQLRHSVREGLSRYAALSLKGRVPVKTAILAADKAGLSVPWLEAANKDADCAKNVPPQLRTNDEVRRQIRHKRSVEAGKSRSAKCPKIRLLNEYAKPIFDRLSENGFEKKLCTSKGHPVNRKIADVIYFEITSNDEHNFGPYEEYDLPKLTTFLSYVGKWRRALQKSSQQKK